MTQRLKMKYRCRFDFLHFPFDNQTCDCIMKINITKNSRLHFVENNPAILHNGPLLLNEFEVETFKTSTKHTNMETTFIFMLQFQRLYFHQLISTFFQTCCLSLLAYLTMFINVANFSDRFMGSVTALLVLAALLASISNDLPKTSYFKYIDIWFLWNITNIFLISAFHVALDQVLQQNKSVANSLNIFFKYMAFPVANLLFFVIFFTLITTKWCVNN